MLRDNLKDAIRKSGKIVKEIATLSEVNKRTIDKWIGAGATEPKVNDLYKVCRVLETTMEWLIDGEDGSEYLREIIRNDPENIQVPDKYLPIMKNLLKLSDTELDGIRACVEVLAAAKSGKQLALRLS